MALHHEAVDRPVANRGLHVLLTRWRWVVYLVLLTFAVVLARATGTSGSPQSPWIGDPTSTSR